MKVTTGSTSVYSCSTKAIAYALKADDTCVTVSGIKICACKTDDCNNPDEGIARTTSKSPENAAQHNLQCKYSPLFQVSR